MIGLTSGLPNKRAGYADEYVIRDSIAGPRN
jgi:hypothetical protein